MSPATAHQKILSRPRRDDGVDGRRGLPTAGAPRATTRPPDRDGSLEEQHGAWRGSVERPRLRRRTKCSGVQLMVHSGWPAVGSRGAAAAPCVGVRFEGRGHKKCGPTDRLIGSCTPPRLRVSVTSSAGERRRTATYGPVPSTPMAEAENTSREKAWESACFRITTRWRLQAAVR